MDKSFKTLDNFLKHFAPEVTARSGTELTDDLKSKIALMANGEITENDKNILIKELLAHPEAMEYLAQMLKEK